MSFVYAHGKKMRKKTRIEGMQKEVAGYKEMTSRLAKVVVELGKVVGRFGAESSWLESHEEDAEGKVTHTDYIWHGEQSPVVLCKEVIEKVETLIGPTFQSLMGRRKPAEDESDGSGDQASKNAPGPVTEKPAA